MTRSTLRTFLLCFFPLGVLAAGIPACDSSPVRDYCDRYCECEDCTSLEYDLCIEQGDQLHKDADELGCGEPLLDVLECAAKNFECGSSPFAQKACEAVVDAYGQCSSST